MATASSHDEVFGLPFLFTGGLPNSLEKFSEGNLKCFLTYLIEVVGKNNRQNVWQKPLWWTSRLIPYSPIAVDTSRVPQDQVLQELRGLIEGCYKYYKAEKILEVSRQLAEIPRILLGIRDNKNNTWTVYDTNSKAVYVTVRPENLHYDLKSLDKVSQDWRSTYTKEDVAFCQIKKASETEMEKDAVIELTDSDEEKEEKFIKRESPRRKSSKTTSPSSDSKLLDSSSVYNSKNKTYSSHCGTTKTSSICNLEPTKSSSRSRGVVIRSGNDIVIAISDSDDETYPIKNKWSRSKNSTRLVSDKSEFGNSGVSQSYKQSVSEQISKKYYSGGEDEVEFVCEFIPKDRPCPKRFKRQPQVGVEFPNVIILSDSDQDNDDSSVYISSYTSLAKNYPKRHFYPETPCKNAQKSILGPLLLSPRKDSQPTQRIARIKLSPQKWPSSASTSHMPDQNERRRSLKELSGSLKKSHDESISRDASSEEEDVLKPTREELYLKKKKKRRFFNPPSPKHSPSEPVVIAPPTQAKFMALLGMNEKSSLPVRPLGTNDVAVPSLSKPDFVASIRSNRASYTRMPLDWIRTLSGSNHIILSKRSSRYRKFDPTHINYEAFCSTDKAFVDYNIKTANSAWIRRLQRLKNGAFKAKKRRSEVSVLLSEC